MDIIDVLLIILLIIASVLGVYLIMLVKRLFVTLDIVENEIKELDEKITPLISDIQAMAESGNSIASFAKEQTELFESMITNFKNKFAGFIPQRRDKSEISPQANAVNLVSNLKALFKGASTFIEEIKK